MKQICSLREGLISMTHPILEQRIRTVLRVIDLYRMGMPRFCEDHHELDVLERTRGSQETPRYVP